MYWYRSRFYDQSLGRFIQPDTLVPNPGDPVAFDRYHYSRNSPIKYTDPNGHAAYCGDDYDPACLDEDETLDFGRMSGEIPSLPKIPDAPIGGDDSSPFDVGVEWLTGLGQEHHEFREGDPFTGLLQDHEHLDIVRTYVIEQLRNGNYLPGLFSYCLSGLSGIPKYIKDYSTLATGGLTGNLAVTYLGSYGLEYHIVSIDGGSGTAVVLFHVWNSSSLASGTRPPVIGYTEFWQEIVSPFINGLVNSGGPMSTVTQDFWWFETINYGHR